MTLVKVNQPKTHRSNFGYSPFDELFGNLFGGTTLEKVAYNRIPAVNVIENEGHYLLEFAAPGYQKEEFKIDIDNVTLTVSGEKKSEQSEQQTNHYTRREFNYVSFKRSFNLPDTISVEQIKAEYKDGILQISLPKKAEEKKTKKEIVID